MYTTCVCIYIIHMIKKYPVKLAFIHFSVYIIHYGHTHKTEIKIN